jgi:Zn-dependent protease
MASSVSIGRVSGIPLRVHWSLLVLLPLFAWQYAPRELLAEWGDAGAAVPWRMWGTVLAVGLAEAAGLFASIVLHELGHSLVARRKGGRIVDIVLLPIGGVARIANLPRRPKDELAVALAGPGVSLALGLLLLGVKTGLLEWGMRTNFEGFPEAALWALYLLAALGWTNVVLALFNLIPAFPMDGGRVFRAALTPRLGRVRATAVAAWTARLAAAGFALWALYPLTKGEKSDFILLMIAMFVWQSAGTEARRAELEADWASMGGAPGGAWRGNAGWEDRADG